MTRTCSDCPAPVSASARRCKSCAAKQKYRDPAAREKMRDAKLRSLAEHPELLERLRQIGSAQLKILHAKARATGTAFREHPVHRCPPHRRDEYQRLRNKNGAPEALRMILEDEAEQVRRAARRAILEAQERMRLKHERDLRERY